jgi:xylose isomerase
MRRESTNVEDMFLAHIFGMDTLARGLHNVVKLIEVTEKTLKPTKLFPCKGF